jgi:hypothetical protein
MKKEIKNGAVRDKKGGIKQKVTQGNDEISTRIWEGGYERMSVKRIRIGSTQYHRAADKNMGLHETDQLHDHPKRAAVGVRVILTPIPLHLSCLTTLYFSLKVMR